MSWLDDDNTTTSENDLPKDRYLKFDDPKVGKSSDLRIRILDAKPARVFRHWIGTRPYNCPGKDADCPVCRERNAALVHARVIPNEDAKKAAENKVKSEFKMDHKYLVNVIIDNKQKGDPNRYEVKIWSFGQQLGMALDKFRRHGELTDMWIDIFKTRKGANKWEISYDATFAPINKLDDDEKLITVPLTDEQISLAEGKYDLAREVAPATLDTLAAALRGEVPGKPSTNGKVTQETLDELTRVTEEAGYNMGHFNINDSSTETEAREVINSLKRA